MNRHKYIVTGLLFSILLTSSGVVSANEPWNLKKCIDYAIENNITVQQQDVSISESEVRLQNSKNSKLPNLNASLGGNTYFGRGPSRDGTYTDNTQISTSFGASANAPIYMGLRIKNEIKSSEFSLKATIQDFEKAKEDLSLQITSLYLQVLFNKEILRVAESQLELSRTLYDRSKILFDNGRASESELSESKSLVAKDDLTVTQANNTLVLSVLDLTQALNIVETEGFDIETPKIDSLPVEVLEGLSTPDKTYEFAVENRPGIKSEQLRLNMLNHDLKVAKSSYYPQISLGVGYNNSYYYSFASGIQNNLFGEQLRRNGNETIGLSISIPIFNRFTTRNQVNLTKLSIKKQELTILDTKRNLNKEIEQAYYSAVAASKKYSSAIESVDAARVAFRFEEEKSQAGSSTIFDFNDSKTRLERSESEMIQAKYEFIFRKKILDFYAGIPLAK